MRSAADSVTVSLNSAIVINCSESTVLQIVDIKVNETGMKCPHQPCNLNDGFKLDIHNHCNGKTSCMLSSDVVNNTCLREFGHINLSYSCKEFPLDCNFERDICGWITTNDNYAWKRSRRLTIPSTDHTLGTRNGFYIYLKSSNIPEGISSNLSSVHLHSGEWCLTFWYYMYIYENGMESLTIYLHDDKEDIVLHTISENTDTWLQARINISISDTKSKSIIFEGMRKRPYTDSSIIAIDDIMVAGGRCSGTEIPLVCNFETDNCIWKATDGNYKWQRNNNYGPSIDHTLGTGSGFYIYLAPEDVNVGTSANLTSKPLQSGIWCLTFWYYMYETDMDSLKVYLYDNDHHYYLYSIPGNQGNQWLQARIDISSLDTKSASIIFNGKRGRFYWSYIAIDDIMIEGGRCSDYRRTCSHLDEPINLMCSKDSIKFNKITFTALDPQFKNCSQVYERMRTDISDFCIDSSAEFCTLDFQNTVLEDLDCFTINRITVEYKCKGTENLQMSSHSSQTIGVIAGIIVGVGCVTALTLVVYCILRGFRLKSASNRHEDITLPKMSLQPLNRNVYDEIQNRTIPSDSKQINTDHATNSGNYTAGQNLTLNNITDNQLNYPYQHLRETGNQTTVPIAKIKKLKPDTSSACSNISNDNEYAIIDPSSKKGINRHNKLSTAIKDDYAILDPNETGFNRSSGNTETKTQYELAVSINPEVNEWGLQDSYVVTENGTYDSCHNITHQESDMNLYSRTVDIVYDTTSHDIHRRKISDHGGTYNHVFGKTTNDNYDVAKRD